MKRYFSRTISIGLSVMLLGIAAAPARSLRIVTTTPELGALAAAIGGERVAVRSITAGREDPHFLQPRPTFVVMARDADVWMRIGLELEIGWEMPLIDNSRNRRIRPGQPGHFDAGAFLPYVLDVPDSTITRAMGDVHASGNPHYMIDPLIARAVAMAMAERLETVDPAGTEIYRQGLNDFLAKLDAAMFGPELTKQIGGGKLWQAEQDGKLEELLTENGKAKALGGWKNAMRDWRGKSVVAFHRSFNYFFRRFEIKSPIELEPVPGVPPSPAHLARVIEVMQAQNVELILMEPFYPRRPAEFVARQTGARIAAANTYGQGTAPDDYIKMMDALVAAFQAR